MGVMAKGNFAKQGNVASKAKQMNLLVERRVEKIPLKLIDEFEENEEIYPVKDTEILAMQISNDGLLEPIKLWKKDDGRYLLCAGHRRKKAYMMLYERTDKNEYGENEYSSIDALVSVLPAKITQLRREVVASNQYRDRNELLKAKELFYRWNKIIKIEQIEEQKIEYTPSDEDSWYSPFSYRDAITILSQATQYSESTCRRYVKIALLPEDIQFLIEGGLVPSSLSYPDFLPSDYDFFCLCIRLFSNYDDDFETGMKCYLNKKQEEMIIKAISDGILVRVGTDDEIREKIKEIVGEEAKRPVTRVEKKMVQEIHEKTKDKRFRSFNKVQTIIDKINFSPKYLKSLSIDEKEELKNTMEEIEKSIRSLKGML